MIKEGTIVYVLSIRDLAFAKVDELQKDIAVLTEHVFSWELNGEKRDFYKNIMGIESNSV